MLRLRDTWMYDLDKVTKILIGRKSDDYSAKVQTFEAPGDKI